MCEKLPPAGTIAWEEVLGAASAVDFDIVWLIVRPSSGIDAFL